MDIYKSAFWEDLEDLIFPYVAQLQVGQKVQIICDQAEPTRELRLVSGFFLFFCLRIECQ